MKKRFITLDENSEVISIRYGLTVLKNEIESELGDLGQIQQIDGTFYTPEAIELPKKETLEEKITRLERQIQQDNLTIFEVLATIYEEQLMKG